MNHFPFFRVFFVDAIKQIFFGHQVTFLFKFTKTAELNDINNICARQFIVTRDPVSDVDTAGNVVKLSILLSGISYGADNDTELNQLDISIYPNPSKGQVVPEFDAPVMGDIELLVSDIAGRRILQKTFMAGQRVDFNLSDQVSGMYFVNIQVDGQHYMKKLILNKE